MNKYFFDKKEEETPLIKQYNHIKSKYPDTVLLFQVGDFYEIFGKDAIKCSKILNIILTKKSKKNIPLAGFPCHSINTYLPKLINYGIRVAICNQIEESNSKEKNIVKRDVVELVTPGIVINDNLLKKKSNNFLSCIYLNNDDEFFGLSLLDISTGEFFITEDKKNYLIQYLNYFKPNEILLQKSKKKKFDELLKLNKYSTFLLNDFLFNYQFSYEKLIIHFKTNSLKGFGIQNMKLGIISAGIILFYLNETHHYKINHISNIRMIDRNKFMWIDDYTFRNLEIFRSTDEKGKSLINILDKTTTPMGGRLLKNWILFPLIEKNSIKIRIDTVKELFHFKNDVRKFIKKKLDNIYDIERIISRMVMGKTNPKEILILKDSLLSIKEIQKKIIDQGGKNTIRLVKSLKNCDHISIIIQKTVNEDAPNQIEIGKSEMTIKKGISKELDQIRYLYQKEKEFLKKLCDLEKIKTKIKNIKIHYNNAFGYSFEIKKKDKNNIPSYWIKKQTLSNVIRYETNKLKNYELKIINAEHKIFYIEKKIIKKLINKILEYIYFLQQNSGIIAKLDILYSFSSNAIENNYSMPNINDSYELSIINGRHPVIEKQLESKKSYIPNSIFLDKKKQQIIIITGPNMSGKSAILRQTAIIILMAHIGSFIPAEFAEIGIIDKIFSRVGSSDNISIGESTFMVEMNETANIINNITDRSFIILDEIGRGTSTYDGISIAQSIIEFLHEHNFKPFTLFATHYHELNNLSISLKRLKNYYISVKKINNNIIFIRKLMKGCSHDSLGIYIAMISGMPIKIVNRAKKILESLNKKNL